MLLLHAKKSTGVILFFLFLCNAPKPQPYMCQQEQVQSKLPCSSAGPGQIKANNYAGLCVCAGICLL